MKIITHLAEYNRVERAAPTELTQLLQCLFYAGGLFSARHFLNMEEPPEYRLTHRTIRTPKLWRVLFSCPLNDLMRDHLANLIHMLCPACAVATVISPGIREEELLATVSNQRFDVAILVLNNVNFSPYDLGRRAATLASNGIALVRKMKEFGMPVIALYGWPRSARHAAILIRAGATFAFQLPFDHEEIKEALLRCLLRADG